VKRSIDTPVVIHQTVFHMNLRQLSKLIAFSTCALFLAQQAFTQEKIITGKVIDGKDGLPIFSVSVVAKGIQRGTQTDSVGNFRLSVPQSITTLTISAIGYSTQKVDISKDSYIQVALASVATTLNDIVVIGYGNARKKDLTGAVASVSEEDFNKGIFISPDRLIQGKVPGVQITTSNGEPGGWASIKVRGNSALTGTGQPLFVLDGVPLDGRSHQAGSNPLNFLSPDDVASIDILKDASATAIYGSRAAYGVVIINTKRGVPGKAKLKVNASVGTCSILRKIDVLNAHAYRDAIKYYNVNPQYDRGADVDALDAILQNGLQQNYTMAIAGGSETAEYRLSGSILDQDALVRNTTFKKYTADLAAKFTLLNSKKLSIDINLLPSQYIKNSPEPGAGATSLLYSALAWNPTDSLTHADGSPVTWSRDAKITPLAMTEYKKDELKLTSILASIQPSYTITKWLDYKLLLSVNYSSGVTRSSINQVILLPNDQRGYASIGNTELTTKQMTHTISFHRDIIPNLNLNAVAGYEYVTTEFKGSSMTGFGAQNIGFGNYGLDYTNYIQYSAPDSRTISSFIDPTYELQSYFGRTVFNYRDRYLLTATLRADGSSKFGANNQYGYFPSFAAAWNIDKEKFFKISFVNALKIRAGWGKTGNQEFPAGSSQARYSFRDNGAIIQVNNPNPDLKWQSDQQTNFGIDFAILNNRISGTFDYFIKTTSNLLYPGIPIQPAPLNSVARWINLDGILKNNGFEALINATVIHQKDFILDISLNGTFLHNEVSRMPSTISTGYLNGNGASGVSVEVIANGLPMNAFYTRKFIGIDKATGFSLHEDNGNTFYYVGNPNPSSLMGFTATIQYKKLSLIANMYGVFGQDIFDNTLLNVINVSGINFAQNIALSVFNDPVKESFANPVAASSRFVYKGNFVKMGNVTFSYNIGDIPKVCSGARIYVTAQNLFMITKYPGFDPETNWDPANTFVPSLGIDWPQYPTARTFTVGINFSL
jgi:iron complex outermembrane receptor protein